MKQTIEERAKAWIKSKDTAAMILDHHGVSGAAMAIYTQAATEQDRIARQEERKKCIDEVCEFMYNFHLPNGVAPLYDYVGNVRKAIEGGEE